MWATVISSCSIVVTFTVQPSVKNSARKNIQCEDNLATIYDVVVKRTQNVHYLSRMLDHVLDNQDNQMALRLFHS